MGFQIHPDFPTSVCVLWCLLHALTCGTLTTSLRSPISTDVSYRELEELDATCLSLDNCREHRTEENLKQFNCLCGPECAKLDACCIDSPFRTGSISNNFFQCRPIYEKKDQTGRFVKKQEYVFMVASCKPQWNGEVEIENLCLSDPEETNDPFLAVPVTSKQYKVTYKNYFCYICNEDSDLQFPTFWNVVLQRNVFNALVPNIDYNPALKSWVVSNPTGSTGQKTPYSLEIPPVVKPNLHACRPDVISTCSSSWTDGTIRAKCMAYTAIVMVMDENFVTLSYKNPHCAICNFQNTVDLFCSDGPKKRAPTTNNPFGSTSQEKVYRLNQKPICGRNMVYDSFSKTCRSAKVSSENSDRVTLADLQSLDAICHRQNCTVNRSGENLNNNNCLCGPDCVKLDVCCVDSGYRTPNPSPEKNLKCLKVYGSGENYVFMKDTCRVNWRGEELIRNLCQSRPETENDPMLAIPTTSPSTHTTYKNYFCFLCNEGETNDGEMPIFWNVVLKSEIGEISADSLSVLNYDNVLNSWTVQDEASSNILKVSLSLNITENSPPVHYCQPDIVSECHGSWTDNIIQKKCLSYMSVVVIDRMGEETVRDKIKYRNLHCAACNYANIEDFYCPSGSVQRKPGHGNDIGSNLFVRMLNLRDDRPCGSGQVYVKEFNKCKTPRCVSRKYQMNNGRCSPGRGK